MLRGALEREAQSLQITIHRPGDSIYIPHVLAHAVLTVDTGSPTVLSGWDNTSSTNRQIIFHSADEYASGVRRGKWLEIFCTKGLSAI